MRDAMGELLASMSPRQQAMTLMLAREVRQRINDHRLPPLAEDDDDVTEVTVTIDADGELTLSDSFGDRMAAAIRASEAEREAEVKAKFDEVHQGGADKLRTLVGALNARNVADVPPGGITPELIGESHWTIMYKLPAMLLASHLPELCEGRGKLSCIAMFDTEWQKEDLKTQKPYPSVLPAIYDQLCTMHDDDPNKLRDGLTALVARVSYLIESENAAMTAPEKRLVTLIRDAAHHVCGQVLYDSLGKAFAHLNQQ